MALPAAPWVPRLLAAAVWCLLLGGLLTMHGLSPHGTGSHGTGSPEPGHALGVGSMAVSTTAGEVAGHGAPSLESGRAGQPRSAPDGGSGQPTGVVTLCLALLASALTAFALVVRRHLRRRPLLVLHRGCRGLLVPARDRDPPDLLGLSVLRC